MSTSLRFEPLESEWLDQMLDKCEDYNRRITVILTSQPTFDNTVTDQLKSIFSERILLINQVITTESHYNRGATLGYRINNIHIISQLEELLIKRIEEYTLGLYAASMFRRETKRASDNGIELPIINCDDIKKSIALSDSVSDSVDWEKITEAIEGVDSTSLVTTIPLINIMTLGVISSCINEIIINLIRLTYEKYSYLNSQEDEPHLNQHVRIYYARRLTYSDARLFPLIGTMTMVAGMINGIAMTQYLQAKKILDEHEAERDIEYD